MIAFILAAANVEIELIASCAAVAMTAVILLIGWLTRTLAVVWLAIGLGLLWSLAIAAVLAYRSDGGKELEMIAIVLFRLVAGVEAILIAVAIWASVKLWRRRPVAPAAPQEPARLPQQPTYDHDWILSLLQSRIAKSGERIAMPGSGGATSPPANVSSADRKS